MEIFEIEIFDDQIRVWRWNEETSDYTVSVFNTVDDAMDEIEQDLIYAMRLPMVSAPRVAKRREQ